MQLHATQLYLAGLTTHALTSESHVEVCTMGQIMLQLGVVQKQLDWRLHADHHLECGSRWITTYSKYRFLSSGLYKCPLQPGSRHAMQQCS